MPAGLVAELVAQHRPARIQNGLRHSGLSDLGRADIADDDQFVLASDLRRPFVKMVLARIRDLGVDRLDAALVARALRNRKRGLVLAVVTERWHLRAVAQRRNVFQAEIYPDFTIAGREIVGDFALEADVPAPTRILHERSGLECAFDLARVPEIELALEVDAVRAPDLHGARDKRHPAKSALRATACAEARAAPVQIARCDELAADRLDSIRVQAEFCGAAGRQLDQVERRRPADILACLASGLCLTLRGDAEVPYLIARPSVAVQVLPCRCVLDAVFEREHHAQIHIGLRGKMQDYRTGRHVFFSLHAHLVFVTKYRRDVLSDLAIRDLAAIFAKVCSDFEAELVECNGEDDHVHLLVNYPPKVQLSKLVNSLKGVSSRRLREIRPEVSGRYYKGVLWSPSYFAASCGGAPISIVRQYVEQQRRASRDARTPIPPRPEGRGISEKKR